MANVFISHRGDDSVQAERLAKDIESHGHNVWLDVWEINVGDSITEKMNEGLTGSTVLILCLSDKGVLAPWISREWYSALARKLNGENIKLLPVRLTGGDPPAILGDVKYADAVADYHNALAQLLKAIGP